MTAAFDLDLYTDREAMRALLQAQMPGFAEGRLCIDALECSRVRCNTSIARDPCRMTLCYELQVREPARQRSGTQLLHAQVFRDAAAAAAAFARHRAEHLVAPAFGAALVHLPALHLLLCALPNDPALPQLTTLLDPQRAARVLPIDTAGLPRVELLRYTPQRRATLRYTLAPRGTGAPTTLYAKTFCDDRAALIAQHFAHFWQLAQRNADAPLVARPLGHDAATRTLWQVAAGGRPLAQALADAVGGPGGSILPRVAQALALLHAAPLQPAPGTTVRSVAHWVEETQRRRQKLARVDGALADRAARVADAIGAGAARQAARTPSLIHGDFHPEQIWIHGDRVVLFDFDEFTLGDPMEDVAEFVLKLGAAGATAAHAAVFVAAYRQAAPQRFDARSLDWHLAIQLLLQASRAFIYQQPGWRDALERRLAGCESHLATLS